MKKKNQFPNKYWPQWSAEYNRLVRADYSHAFAYLRANALVAAVIEQLNEYEEEE